MNVKKFWSVLVCVGCLLPLQAQKSKSIIKAGCVDLQRIIDKVGADQGLKSFLDGRKSDSLRRAEDLAKQINQLKELISKEGARLEAERVKKIQQDIAAKEEELKGFLTDQSAGLQQKEEALSYRIQQNVYDFIKDTAVRGGYSIIFEKGTAVLWVDSEIDLTDEVLKAMEKEKAGQNQR